MVARVLSKIVLIIVISAMAVIPLGIMVLSPRIQPTEKSLAQIDDQQSSTTQSDSILTATQPLIKKVFVIAMHKQSWNSIQNSPAAPFINTTLLPHASYATNYYMEPGSYSAEANYMALESGTTFNIKDDGSPEKNHHNTQSHLVTQLSGHGLSWKSYQEDITANSCPLANQGKYNPSHNPMVFFDDVTDSNNPDSVACTDHVRTYTELTKDLQNNTVSDYTFITPNTCDDMTSTTGCSSNDPIKNGDVWLSKAVPQILNAKAYRDGGVLFITWIGDGKNNTPYGTIMLSSYAKGGGYKSTVRYTPSSLLKTIQEIFGVTPLLGNAATTTDMSDMLLSLSESPRKMVALQEPTVSTLPTQTVTTPNTPSLTPTAMLTPTILASIQSTSETEWNTYKENSVIGNAGFSFTYPKEWHVLVRTQDTSYQFVFSIHSDIDSGQVMTVDTFAPATSIQSFISMHFPEYKDMLVSETVGKVGNETLYKIFPKQELLDTKPALIDFGSRGVILGKQHAYTVSFDDNGTRVLIDQIESKVWHTFTFK